MDNLQSVGEYLRIGDINVPNLSGLENLSTIGGNLRVENNNSLENLNGLEQLTQINSSILLQNNPELISLMGLENLTTVLGDFTIDNNPSITNINSLQSLTFTGARLLVARNDQLPNLVGLENLNSVGELSIDDNQTLTSLEGLTSLTEVNGNFSINANFNLYDISSLTNINIIEGNLSITNTRTETLNVFENINAINGRLNISNNTQLVNIDGIRNIDGTTITELWIQINSLLSQCAVESVCNFLNINPANTNIVLNATGCENREEVEAACALGTEENQITELKIYPNPTNGTFEISGLKEGTIEIIDSQGRKVKDYILGSDQLTISEFSQGIYFIKITSENTFTTKQLVKI